jgi:hypothetical protein
MTTCRKVDGRLALALYALKEEATNEWKRTVEGEPLDAVALQRSWDQVVRELMRLDAEGK